MSAASAFFCAWITTCRWRKERANGHHRRDAHRGDAADFEAAEKGGRLILTAHLGRPKGKRDATRSLDRRGPVVRIVRKPVTFVDVHRREGARRPWPRCGAVGKCPLLQRKGKERPGVRRKAGEGRRVYVNDAFGAAHRAHASTEGVARLVAKRGGDPRGYAHGA